MSEPSLPFPPFASFGDGGDDDTIDDDHDGDGGAMRFKARRRNDGAARERERKLFPSTPRTHGTIGGDAPTLSIPASRPKGLSIRLTLISPGSLWRVA